MGWRRACMLRIRQGRAGVRAYRRTACGACVLTLCAVECVFSSYWRCSALIAAMTLRLEMHLPFEMFAHVRRMLGRCVRAGVACVCVLLRSVLDFTSVHVANDEAHEHACTHAHAFRNVCKYLWKVELGEIACVCVCKCALLAVLMNSISSVRIDYAQIYASNRIRTICMLTFQL